MSSTGDLQNNFKQLANELKKVKYGKKLDVDLIVSGSPKAYLPIYNFLFTSYNSKINEDIVNSNNELYGKSDMRFMEAVYKIMRDMFDYKAKITRDQFFAPGFSEQKVIMAKEVLHLVRGRYSPPKNKRFHVTASRSGARSGEKVPQEPTEIVQKVSIKQPSPTNIAAGAIVLPSRQGSGMASSSRMIRVGSGQGLLGPKHNQERPVFVEYVRAVSSASSSSVGANSWRSHEHAQAAPIVQQPLVVKATGNPTVSHFAPLPAHNDLPYVGPASIRAELLSGMGEKEAGDLEDSEEEEGNIPTQQPMRTESALSAALVNLLSQQMNDVVFKLQTLTSRITLLENRVTMVEAQLKDEKSQRMTLFASQSYNQAKKSNGGWPVGHVVEEPVCNTVQSLPAQSRLTSYENSSMPRAPVITREKRDKRYEPGDNNKLPPDEQNGYVESDRTSSKSSKEKNKVPWDYSGKSEPEADCSEEEVAMKSHALAFMKSLVHPEDCSSLLTTSGAEPPEILAATESADTTQQNESTLVEPAEALAHLSSEETTHKGAGSGQNVPHSNEKVGTNASSFPPRKSKSSKSKSAKPQPPFSQNFSPIRPFSDLSSLCLNQDESVSSMVFAGTGYVCDDESSPVGRRSSTPSGPIEELDTSTLDRIGRINQMMEATKQLLY